MTTEKILEREHGKRHVTVTTIRCKLQQWDRTYSYYYNEMQVCVICVLKWVANDVV